MNQALVSQADVEQLKGHVRLVRQGTASAVAAAMAAFHPGNGRPSAALAVDVSDDVAAVCRYCGNIAEILLEHASTPQRSEILDALDSVRELSDITLRAKQLAQIAERFDGVTAAHPSLSRALRDLARRVDGVGSTGAGHTNHQAS
ncbi:hypothetical protein [Smaragdicoccus niigatensis]|uniref:hypothetical protein n=1 Tax=Smaragdicoccus niigatensis TaxID=359359 RepID=UPI000399DC4A|nr:hypothetical protein [Smaragdicoccus niigatensis]